MLNIRDFFKDLKSKQQQSSSDDAVELLKADHRTVESLFAKFKEATKASDKRRLVLSIVEELTIHATIEEKLVYPIIDQVDHDMAGEALQEHHVVKFLLRELKNGTINDETEAKVTVLKELVAHHVKEEESEIFPKLAATDEDMQKLGKALKAKKAQIKQSNKNRKLKAVAATPQTTRKPAKKTKRKAS